jgi:type VI secretion system FHA domain protein
MPLQLRIQGDKGNRLGELQSCTFAACGGTIGRAPDNDWAIPDPNRYLSSRHALIDFQAGAYYLVDTSRNGVYINGADIPVGKGHPQRLFDGDRLRLGDLDIKVEITGNDERVTDDGMRDSVVRAQLVQEDESVELQFVAEERMMMDSALQRHLRAENSMRAQRPSLSAAQAAAPGAAAPTPHRAAAVGQKPRGQAATARALAAPAPEPDPAADPRQLAVAELLEAAGLEPDAAAGASPAELLQTTGRLLRLLTAGLMEMLRERGRLKEELRLPQTVIQAAENNPLNFAPSVEEALRLMLRDRGDAYLRGEESAGNALGELRQHEEALQVATHRAVRAFVERFDPDELKRRFDQGLKRPALLASANRLKYWELYEEAYQVLVQADEGSPPRLFNEDFARAYTEEVENSRRRGRR